MVKLEFFVFVLYCSLAIAKPLDTVKLLSDAEDNGDYDIIIDQRQNGTQNFRIKISGVTIAIPDDRHEQPSDSPINTIEQFASLLTSPTKVSNQPHRPTENLNDLAELGAFFDWKKNVKSSSKKSPEDTQSRTKDIPTDIQLADDLKTKTEEFAKEEHRKYKLLVGEKYIIPILNFLKKQTEDVKE